MIHFLVKRYVVFICERCGESVQMFVPLDGATNTKSYCCQATYAVVEQEGHIHVARLADQERDIKRDYGEVPVAMNVG